MHIEVLLKDGKQDLVVACEVGKEAERLRKPLSGFVWDASKSYHDEL